MADSEVTAEERQKAEEEWQKIQEDPEYYEENYVDITEDFLPAEVDKLLADLQLGNIKKSEFINKFEDLSPDHKKIFLEQLPDCFPPKKRRSA